MHDVQSFDSGGPQIFLLMYVGMTMTIATCITDGTSASGTHLGVSVVWLLEAVGRTAL